MDLVVLLSHNGFPQDIKMLSNVEGVDVCLRGHTHNRIREAISVNGAIAIQSGCHGSFIGRIDLNLGSRGVKRCLGLTYTSKSRTLKTRGSTCSSSVANTLIKRGSIGLVM